MKRLVFDIESNGLLDTVDKVWCIAGVCIEDGSEHLIKHEDLTRQSILDFFSGYDIIVGHNIIDFDIPLLLKMYNIDLYNKFNPLKVVDTCIWSRTLFPDRELPEGCPTVVKDEVTGKSKKITPHSLEALGFSVGMRKIQISDWTVYNEQIIDRCIKDVKINIKVYEKLLKEASLLE